MNILCDYLIKKINSYLLPDEIYLMILNKYTNKIFIDLTKLYKLNWKIFEIFQSTSAFQFLPGNAERSIGMKMRPWFYRNINNLLAKNNFALSGYTRLSIKEYTLVKELTKNIKKHIKNSNTLNIKYKSYLYTDIKSHPSSLIDENLYRFHIYLQQ